MLTRRDVTIGFGALGAGALAARPASLNLVSMLGGGAEFEVQSVHLRSVSRLRFSYQLPELFSFSAYSKPNPDGASTSLYFPQSGDGCSKSYIDGCDYTGRVHITHEDLPSDLYLARVERHFCPLTIPPHSKKNEICVLTPDHTYTAYNKFEGKGLYTPEISNKYGYVNGNRPLQRLSWFHNPIKLNIFKYLRANKFAYDVLSHEFLEISDFSLEGYKLLIIYGHDEYWSQNFRNAVERHLHSGGSLLNLSGNTCYWRVRIDGDRFYVDKRGENDLWRKFDPEEKILGASFHHGGFALPKRFKNQDVAFRKAVESIDHPDLPLSLGMSALSERLSGIRLTDVSHPIFDQTGLKAGDWIGTGSKVVAHELDGVPLNRDSSVDWKLAEHVPRDVRIFGETWSTKDPHLPNSGVRHCGVMLSFKYKERGRVMAFPTIGWTRALAWDDDEVVGITNNAIRFLLEEV